MSKKLTAEMIVKRARGNFDLPSIRKLNFWGLSLDDISVISECISLESATFSKNYISSLKCFRGMNNLRELSLANNSINDLHELTYLGTCPNLRKLWLKDNPISKLWDYRIQVIRMIPNLQYLDDEEITPDERAMANTGSFFERNYEKKRENVRPPSHEAFRNRERNNKNNNFEQYGGVYNRLRRDYESENIPSDNYLGILPGMVDDNKKYLRYDRFQNRKPDTPGKVYDRYGNNGRRGITPTPTNNSYHYQNDDFKVINANNINQDRSIGYNEYGRNIPGSAQSHYRRYGNNNQNRNQINQMEVSTTSTQQGQQGVVDCVTVLLKGLSDNELLYIFDHIDKKISKI